MPENNERCSGLRLFINLCGKDPGRRYPTTDFPWLWNRSPEFLAACPTAGCPGRSTPACGLCSEALCIVQTQCGSGLPDFEDCQGVCFVQLWPLPVRLPRSPIFFLPLYGTTQSGHCKYRISQESMIQVQQIKQTST